jgi:hypothetical protein
MTLIIYKDKLPRAQVAAEQAATAIWKARAGQNLSAGPSQTLNVFNCERG